MGPMLDLNQLGKPHNKTFSTKQEEVDVSFDDAAKWLGIIMQIKEFRKFIWSNKTVISEQSMLNADCYDNDRRKTIKWKIKKYLRINDEQVDIEDYYITTRGGLIAWVKLDPRLVAEVHRRSAGAAIKDFRSLTFIPKIARERKAAVDELLLEYKKTNPDFRYIIRNSNSDITVLIKRISEDFFLPHRKISLDVLGALPSLKTQIRGEDSDEAASPAPDGADTSDEFQAQKGKKKRPNFMPKELIFRNIDAILNGFETEAQPKKKKS